MGQIFKNTLVTRKEDVPVPDFVVGNATIQRYRLIFLLKGVDID